MIRTPVDLDESVFWKLAGVAEQHDMRVDEYLAELAVMASRRRNPVESDPVASRWRLGMTDKEIAGELAMTNLAVAVRRRSFGLPANKRSR